MKTGIQYAIVAAFVLGIVELASFLATGFLVSQRIILEPPDDRGYVEYLASRDPLLGWPAPQGMTERGFDSAGSRVTPRFPDPSVPSCVATFGDSFTWGEEVTAEHAYGNVLSDMLGCRVANYGVGGYGTDQALLRYRDRIVDPAPIVILGHYSDNIMRNVNQLRDLTSGARFGFKPRFRVDDTNGLTLVPIPTLTPEEYPTVNDRAAELLPYEYFVPDRLGGPVNADFPYTRAMIGAIFHFRVVARLRGVPSYAAFYDPSHPSEALATTEAIMLEFATVARSRGQQPLIVLIPDEKDLRAFQQGNLPAYESLRAWLRQEDLPGPDIATYMLDHLAGSDVCELFVTCGGRSHYNERGYRLLADGIYRWILESSLAEALPEPSRLAAIQSEIH